MRHRPLALAMLALVFAPLPRAAAALEREVRTGPVTTLPPSLEPSPPVVQLWIDGLAAFDGAPATMTLSDGSAWRRDPARPRWDVGLGGGAGRFAGELRFGQGTFALALEWRWPLRPDLETSVTAGGVAVYGGGYDLSLQPAVAGKVALAPWVALVPFGALRFRGGETLYEVQGAGSSRASPFASALTRDRALALLAGAGLVTRVAELRLTAGWEWLLSTRIVEQDRNPALSHGGGFFGAVLLRFRLRSTA